MQILWIQLYYKYVFPVFIESPSVAVGDTETFTGKQTDAETYPMFCHPEACLRIVVLVLADLKLNEERSVQKSVRFTEGLQFYVSWLCV